MFSHERPEESDDQNQSSHVLGPTHPFTITACLLVGSHPIPLNTPASTLSQLAVGAAEVELVPLQNQVTSASAGPRLPEQVGQLGTEPPKG